MRPRTAVVIAALGLCVALAGPRLAGAETALGESSWSLEIGTWLGSGNGDASIAIRRHSGASTAWRIGVEADLNKSDGEGTWTSPGVPDVDVSRYYESNELAFIIQWMRFAQVRDNLTATLAIGPVIQHDVSVDRYDYAFSAPSIDQAEYKDVSTLYGLDLGFGVEWFFSRRFSLGAQVGLRAMAGTTTSTSISRQDVGAPTYSRSETEIESDVTDLETSGGKILLSAYF